MDTTRTAFAMALVTLITAGVLGLSLGERSTVIAQNSAGVSCNAMSCFSTGYSKTYDQQCSDAEKAWEQNKRTCESVFNHDQQAMQKCINGFDYIMTTPCTCAANCSRALCSEWNLYNHTCKNAEWR